MVHTKYRYNNQYYLRLLLFGDIYSSASTESIIFILLTSLKKYVKI